MDYYDNTHMRIIREITGPEHFPLSHTRHYIYRTGSNDHAGGPSNPKTPATLFKGQQATVDFDCVAVLTFKDENAFHGFYGALSSPEAAAKIDGDEIVFQDPTKSTVVLVGGVSCTTKS